MTFGEKLVILRKQKCMSKEELSKNIGVSYDTICKWEKNLSEPKLKYVINIADFFDISIDYLISSKND